VKFSVRDLRVMPLIKKSHVVYSKFSSRFENKLERGTWNLLIWLMIGTHAVWPPVTVMILGKMFLWLIVF
jgi:hypothetical protein